MTDEPRPDPPGARTRGGRLGAALAAAAGLVVIAAAGLLWWLHASAGLPMQRVNVRWKEGVGAAERAEAERTLGLERGEDVGSRTWSYTVRDRSRTAVGAILNSPLVADTHHIAPAERRIVLEPPNPARIRHRADRVLLRLPALLPLLQADVLPWAAPAAGGVGLILLAIGRRALMVLLRWSWTAARVAAGVTGAAARTVGRGAAALDTRLGYAPAPGAGPLPSEYLGGVVMALVFLAPLLWYGPYEEEVVQHSIFPSQMFYRALFQGEWLYWLNDLGFGGPLPGDLLLFHPIAAPLLAFSPVRVALSALWIAHAAVMAIYFLRLAALSQIRSPSLRLLLLAAYLWSAVGLLYHYDTDWITNAIAWGLYPVLVFALYQGVRGPTAGRLASIVGLALLFAFWILNAHPGYVAPLVSVLVVYAVAAAPLKVRVYAALGVAAVLCVAATSAHLYALAHEARLFVANTSLERTGATLAYYTHFALRLAPADRRAPLIGLALLVAAVAGALAPSTWRDPHRRATAAAFVAAFGLGLLPGQVVQWLAPSGSLLFRDPYIFFGLLLGGTTLQRLLDRGHRRWVAILIVCQVVQQGSSVVRPAMTDFLAHKHALLFYRYQDQAVGLGRDLVETGRRFGRRLYLSPRVEDAFRGKLSADGVHFSSDLVFIGLNPVNAWFKNVAMDPIYPPYSLMESYIRGDLAVIANQPLLDVLGINVVLTSEREGPLPGGLEPITQSTTGAEDLEGDLIIAANRDAWPKAVLLDTAAASVALPVREGCVHTAALCRDYESIVPHRLPGAVSLRERNGAFAATFPPSDAARLLFISSLYRPEWEAASGDGSPLDVRPVAHAFLGVAVPPGVDRITVAYRPRALQALTWFSTLTFFGLGAAWIVLKRRTARGRML